MTDPLAPPSRRSQPFRLTALAHAAAAAARSGPPAARDAERRLLRFQHRTCSWRDDHDDAAVYASTSSRRSSPPRLLHAIVDDPFEFGAFRDTHCRTSMPWVARRYSRLRSSACLGKMPSEVMRRIMEGGADVCRAAGIRWRRTFNRFAEPIYGLAVIGLGEPAGSSARRCPAATCWCSQAARIGVLSSALKKGILDEQGYARCSTSRRS